MGPPDVEALGTRFPALVRELSSDERDALARAFEVHEAGAGEALVIEGTETDELFAVDEGRLDIVVSGPAGARRVAGVEAGSLFGEVSLFDPGPSGATIVTEAGCRVLRLGAARYDALCASSPAAAASLQREVLRSLSARLRAVGGRHGGEATGGAG